jgi:hypothetical protein
LNDGQERVFVWFGSGWASIDDGLVVGDLEISANIKELLEKSGLNTS